MLVEIWRDSSVSGYKVSNHGRIYSCKTSTIRKTYHRKDGYESIGLSIDGKIVTFAVHRLVAEAFIENPENHPVVNHKDGNKLNNYASNLEWTTQQENIIHSYKNEMSKACRGETNGLAKLTWEKVEEIRRLRNSENISYAKLSKMFDVGKGTVWQVVNNVSWNKK